MTMKNKKFAAIILAMLLLLSFTPAAALQSVGSLVRVLVEPTLVFDSVYAFRDGLSWVKRDGKVGFVNYHGEIVVPLEFDSASFFFRDGLAQVWRDGMVGEIDMSGQFVAPLAFTYSESGLRIAPNHRGVGRRYGVLDRNGNIILPKIYSSWDISFRGDFIFILNRSQGRTSVYDSKGNQFLPRSYAHVMMVDDFFIANRGDWNNRQYGIYDSNGNVVLPFEYDNLYIRDGVIRANVGRWPDNLTGLYDLQGNNILPVIYSNWTARGGFFIAELNGKMGIFDSSGNIVLPFEYSNLTFPFSTWIEPRNDLIVAAKDGKTGIITIDGTVIQPFEYDRVYPFVDGLAAIVRGDMIAFIDESGEIVTPFEYGVSVHRNNIVHFEFDSIRSFTEGLAAVTWDGMVGFVDESYEFVIPFRYGAIGGRTNNPPPHRWTVDYWWHGGFQDGLAVISGTPLMYDWRENTWELLATGSQLGLINREGNIVLPLEYDSISSFSEGLATVGKRNVNITNGDDIQYSFGVVDIYGNFVIPLEYGWIGQFNDGVAIARRGDWNGYWGLIDRKGNEVIPFGEGRMGWLEVWDYWNEVFTHREPGVVRVTRDGKSGLYDVSGNVIIPAEYDVLRWDNENRLFHAHIDDKVGLIGLDGIIITPVEFDSIRLLEDGKWLAVSGGEAVVVKTDGTVIVPCAVETYNMRIRVVWRFNEISFVEIDGEIFHTVQNPWAIEIMENQGVFWIYEDGLYGIIDVDPLAVRTVRPARAVAEVPYSALPYYETGNTSEDNYEVGYISADVREADTDESENGGIGIGVIVLTATGGTALAASVFFTAWVLYKKPFKKGN